MQRMKLSELAQQENFEPKVGHKLWIPKTFVIELFPASTEAKMIKAQNSLT